MSTLNREIFPAPFFEREWPEDGLNAGLREAIQAQRLHDKGMQISNSGGWHSSFGLQHWDHSAIPKLLDRVAIHLKESLQILYGSSHGTPLEGWSIEAWANVASQGCSHGVHRHMANHDTTWSGIYYIDPGSPSAKGGRTFFEDYSGLLPAKHGEVRRHTIQPRSSLMVMFPASLAHGVECYEGEGERITISWNIAHPDFALPHPGHTGGTGFRGWLWENFRGVMLGFRSIKDARNAKRRNNRKPLDLAGIDNGVEKATQRATPSSPSR